MAVSRRRCSVMVVGSDPVTLAMLEEPFERNGLTVESISLPSDARQVLSDRPADLIVVDLERHPSDGLHLIEHLHHRRGDRARSIIALTGSLNPYRDVTLSLHAGADMYVARPIRVSVVLACAHTLLARAGRDATAGPDDWAASARRSGELVAPAPDDRSTSWTDERQWHHTHKADASYPKGLARSSEPPVATDGFRTVPLSGVLRRSQPGYGRAASTGRLPSDVRQAPGETGDFHTPVWSLFRTVYSDLDRALAMGRPAAVLVIDAVPATELDAEEQAELSQRFFRRSAAAMNMASCYTSMVDYTTCAVIPDTDEIEVADAVKRLIDVVERRRFSLHTRSVRAGVRVGVAISDPASKCAPFIVFDTAYKALRCTQQRGAKPWMIRKLSPQRQEHGE